MNRIFNWVFGSFFRTLGRVLVYIILGFLLCYLLKDLKLPNLFTVLDVHAETTVKIYDTTLTSNNYVVVPSGTRIINISDDTVYGQYGSGEVPPQYYIGTFCTDSSNISNWEGTSMNSSGGSGTTYSNTLVQLNFYNTKYTCTFPNSTYSGHIVYVYGQINPILSTSATTMYLMGRISFTQPSQASWSLLSWAFSNDSLDIDYANDTVISQNQEVINQNQTIISQNNRIYDKTQEVIDHNNQQQGWNRENATNNANNIINNQNTNTDKEIDSQRVCEIIDKGSITIDGKYLNEVGNIRDSSNFGVTDYIKIGKDTDISRKYNTSNDKSIFACFYYDDKTKISCFNEYNTSEIIIPDGAKYIRFTIFKTDNRPQYEICKNGNQAIGDSINDMNSSINNSDSSQAANDATSFFNNFATDTHGLTGIITAPLNAIRSLSSQQCTPLVLPLPFVNEDLTLPCMRDIYTQYFGDFMTLYDIITLGIISYWVMVRIFGLVKDFKNPEHDEIEVLDL